MWCRSRLGAQAPRRRSGFTLVELAIVIVILGVITSIAMANFMRFRNRAKYASCVSNQRHVVEASLLYISVTSPGTSTFDVDVLTGGGYLSQEAADCPKSTAHTMNDYTIHVVNNAVEQIDCKIETVQHQWNVP